MVGVGQDRELPEFTDDETTDSSPYGEAAFGTVQRFELEIVDGEGRGRVWESVSDRCSVGSHPSNDLALEDSAVSRFHCEIVIQPRQGARVRDLESRNGTVLDGVVVVDAFLRDGSLIRIGNTTLRFHLEAERNQLPISPRTRFGALVGRSATMRTTFALLERAAESDVTVLLEGETGTGKERAAEAIHEASTRAEGPFVPVDCAAIPAGLLESELFGHEKGAFTGAVARATGAFEAASGGTLFLDEIGELPLDLQPKLLRVVEQRSVRRIGSNQPIPLDVRLIAATNRSLRTETNAGRFRPDLYYRLAVLRIPMPSLRSRAGDIPDLVDAILESLGAGEEDSARLRDPEWLARLQGAAWPGNVRELRNTVERSLVLGGTLIPDDAPPRSSQPPPADLSYSDARRQALDAFERDFVQRLLARHQGRVAEAARAAGMDRAYLYRLMKKQ